MSSSALFVVALVVAVAVASSGRWGGVDAYEENSRFCIRTDPVLLAEIEKHLIAAEPDPNCDITATTMSSKEKESFLNTMCKDHGSTHRDDYHFLKLRHGELNGRASYREICSGKMNPLLAWIPYEMLQRNYIQELNPKERLNYIAKATDVEREKSELCHFRHSDLVADLPENLFSCIVMIFEDNFYGLDANINVLVELQPVMYEVRNVTCMPWMNGTASYKTILGRTSLRNPSGERKQIYSSLDYSFVEKIRLNGSTVYTESMERLPLLFEHKDVVVELDADGTGGINVKEKAYFGHSMDAKSTIKLEVIGQWAEHRRQFKADVYEYFGYGVKRFRHEMHGGDVTFVRIESTEPVFEFAEATNLALPHVFGAGKQFARLTANATAAEWDDRADGGSSRSGDSSLYPGFYPWFVLSVLVFGVVVLVFVGGMVRSCSEQADKHQYKLTGV